MKITDIPQVAHSVSAAAGSIVRGAEDTIYMLTAALLCGGHVLLEDLPGTGKTTLVKAFAVLTGCDSRRIQCTPDLMPADLTGFELLVQQPDGSRSMQFRKGPVFTNLLLADEINRMAPRSQAGLLECMAEQQVTAGGTSYSLPKPFFVIATQNPIELQGTFPLPEAQLDRFFMCLSLGTPDREHEREVLKDRQTADPLDALKPVTDPDTLLDAQQAVRSVAASDDTLNYLLDLADATRRHKQIRFGLSTRGALAVRHAAQAAAAMEGRDYLLPDDIKKVFPAVCAHRIHAAEGLLTDRQAALKLVDEILNSVPVPKS
ncbi:MAG: MoxR family ATPase [Oscillospiraceae bacterium]|nr:MoxR family ATPase [Oscillospiraceae bacterium]